MPTNTPTPVTTDEFDPFAAASNPALPAFELWGMMEVNAWACALVKGQGKVPYDQAVHDRRATAIDLFIQPLPELNITNTKSCERHLIAESKEWANVVWASIKECGIMNLRELNGKYVRVAVVPSGRTYLNKNNEKKDETTFKIVAVYENEEKCKAAYLSNGGTDKSAPATTESPAVNEEIQNALAFLKVIVPNAIKGKEKLEDKMAAVNTTLAQYPTVSKFFNVLSPEVAALMGV